MDSGIGSDDFDLIDFANSRSGLAYSWPWNSSRNSTLQQSDCSIFASLFMGCATYTGASAITASLLPECLSPSFVRVPEATSIRFS